jgi:predicted DNA-binding transcriptional regulator AlpA
MRLEGEALQVHREHSEPLSAVAAITLLRLAQVLQIVPISRSAWWAGVRTGKYPAPLKLGPKTTVWRASDIRALVDRLGKQGS